VLFAEVAVPLHQQGYRPIPLHPETKIPAEPGWNVRNTSPWPDRDLELAARHHPDAACGIAVPSDLLALDLDVTEPSAAARLRALADEHLGETPLVRVGLPPKSVRLYQSDGTVVGAKPHPVEIYSGTGQVAVFGWHAKADKPYTWPTASPLEVRADELPVVTGQQTIEFLAAAAPVLRNLRRAGGRGAAGVGTVAGDQLGAMLRRGVPFNVAARLVLEGASDGGRHYAVRAVISHGYNRGMSYEQIDRVIQRGAPPELLEHVGNYTERTLIEFEPRGRDWT
jgi:hypothetical protein